MFDVNLMYDLMEISHPAQEALNKRLDTRVDSMVKDGLLAEIRSFYDENVVNR